jgi:hypothetical protein
MAGPGSETSAGSRSITDVELGFGYREFNLRDDNQMKF